MRRSIKAGGVERTHHLLISGTRYVLCKADRFIWKNRQVYIEEDNSLSINPFLSYGNILMVIAVEFS